MFKINKAAVTVATLAAVAVGLGTLGIASAAAPASTVGNVETHAASRIVDVPGMSIAKGQTVTIQVAGKGLVPANATGEDMQITSINPSAAGGLVLFTAGTGAPGPTTVDFAKGQEKSVTVPVTFSAAGAVSVRATVATRFLLTAIRSVVPVAPAAATGGPVTTTGTTTVSGREDSGDHGNWATDSFGRTLSVTRHAAAPVSNCGVTSGNCWFYTATISDSGSFVTDDGALSPSAGTAVHGTVAGQFNGGEAVEFYASTDTAVQPPATVSGNSPTTTDWVKQAFATGTHFSSVTTKDGWSWTYTAPATCEQWVDASAGQTGDITGVNAC
jgi:hypothetical protein